jgi:DNA-directed RNA polymerase specialized sigma24 family protein
VCVYPVILVDPSRLNARAAQAEHVCPIDRPTLATLATARMTDIELREIVLECLQGMTLEQSAQNHGLSVDAVFRRRKKGLEQLRRILRDELVEVR